MRVEPSAGSAGRPHVVRVIGEHFLDRHVMCSADGEHNSSALWRSSTVVECMMPALPTGRVPVQVSNNGVDYSEAQLDSAAVFEYRAEAQVISMSPSIGPVGGGTAVQLLGSWPAGLGSMSCTVGLLSVRCGVVSSSSVQCMMPASSRAGAVPVHVRDTTNAVGAGLVARLEYEYVATPVPMRLVPSQGPLHGGNVVTVVGEELGWRSMMCHMQEQDGAAWRGMARGSTAVLCMMPARSAEASVVLEVSVNGVDTSEQGLCIGMSGC